MNTSAPLNAETVFVNHCHAVAYSKKPAELFTLPLHLLGDIKPLLRMFDMHWICFSRRPHSALLFVYRPALLSGALAHKTTRAHLRRAGYPVEASLAAMLAFLQQKINEPGSFPHEVGFFLGYPPQDVIGFIQNGGCRYKACGKWKVYGNKAEAEERFAEYAHCKRQCRRLLREARPAAYTLLGGTRTAKAHSSAV